jgi:hypothetical protein
MRRLILCAALLLPIIACAPEKAERDSTGRTLGAPDWIDIAPAASSLGIIGTGDHRHQIRKLTDRYIERVRFSDGTLVYFERPTIGILAAGSLPPDIIAGWYRSDSSRAAGFVFRPDRLERVDDYYLVTDSGRSISCSQLVRLYGTEPDGPRDSGPQHYQIIKCETGLAAAAERTRQQVLDVARRLDPRMKSPPRRAPTLSA